MYGYIKFFIFAQRYDQCMRFSLATQSNKNLSRDLLLHFRYKQHLDF